MSHENKIKAGTGANKYNISFDEKTVTIDFSGDISQITGDKECYRNDSKTVFDIFVVKN